MADDYAEDDFVVTIGGNAITPRVDGALFGAHTAAHLPERPMSINFNQWLIDPNGQPSTAPRAHGQQVDYVLHVEDRVLGPARVAAEAVALRSAGTTFVDEAPAS